MGLDRRTIHIDRALTNYSKKLGLFDLTMAPRVAPGVGVRHESDLYWVFGREELRDQGGRDLRADGAKATEYCWRPKGQESYVANEYALKCMVTDRAQRNADEPLRPLRRTVDKLAYNLRLQHEIRTADLLLDPASGIVDLPVALPWSAAAADIEADVKAAKFSVFATTGVMPNTIVIARELADSIVDYLKASAEISIGEKAQLFEMPSRWLGLDVVVVDGHKNTAEEDLLHTETLESVWDETKALVCYVNPRTPSLEDMTIAMTFEVRPFRVKRWRDEECDGTWLQVDWLHTEKLTCPEAGVLLSGLL